jgi:flagellar motor switch protein FliG
MAGTDTGVTEQSGAEMAAAVLIFLGESVAASVLRHMDERSIGVISDAMARSRSLDSTTASSAMVRLATDLESHGMIPPDGFGYLRRLLVSAFGEDKAGDMMERIMRSSGGPIDVLSHSDPRMLAEQLAGERPQLLAVLLGHMNRLTAVSFLGTLPEERASEVVYRFARMDAVQPAAMTELRAMLSEALGGQIEARTATIGGVRNAAELLNGMGSSASEKALEQIREVDPELADRLRENMFTFDDLLNLGDQALQAILRVVPSERLGPALRAAPLAVRTRVLDNLSKKAADYLRDEIENGPMVTRADAHAAQRTIIEAAMSLAAEGKLSLRGDEDML